MQGKLNGKIGSVFSSTGTQHGGQETTLMGMITNLFHLGLVVVGLPYSAQGLMRMEEITGGTPYGVTTLAGAKSDRKPSANELELARFQGRHVAEITAALQRGRS